MANANIIFSKPKAWWKVLSPIIRFFQKTTFSHCVIYHEGFIYEATWPKARKISLDLWLKDNEIVFMLNKDVNMHIAEELVGRPYSFMQLFWALFDVKFTLNSVRGLICSEFIARCLINPPHDQLDSFDLNDLYDYLRGP